MSRKSCPNFLLSKSREVVHLCPDLAWIVPHVYDNTTEWTPAWKLPFLRLPAHGHIWGKLHTRVMTAMLVRLLATRRPKSKHQDEEMETFNFVCCYLYALIWTSCATLATSASLAAGHHLNSLSVKCYDWCIKMLKRPFEIPSREELLHKMYVATRAVFADCPTAAVRGTGCQNSIFHCTFDCVFVACNGQGCGDMHRRQGFDSFLCWSSM